TCWDDGITTSCSWQLEASSSRTILTAESLRLTAFPSSFFQKQQKSFVKDTIFHKPVLLNNPLHRLIHTVST
ncbi:hypothetical protein AB4339_14370, partial [Vibrio breoganii]